jgi:hypothetical protein
VTSFCYDLLSHFANTYSWLFSDSVPHSPTIFYTHSVKKRYWPPFYRFDPEAFWSPRPFSRPSFQPPSSSTSPSRSHSQPSPQHSVSPIQRTPVSSVTTAHLACFSMRISTQWTRHLLASTFHYLHSHISPGHPFFWGFDRVTLAFKSIDCHCLKNWGLPRRIVLTKASVKKNTRKRIWEVRGVGAGWY